MPVYVKVFQPQQVLLLHWRGCLLYSIVSTHTKTLVWIQKWKTLKVLGEKALLRGARLGVSTVPSLVLTVT